MNQFLDTATILAIALSWLIPLLSSLLARAHWPGEVVGILTLLISAANGFLSEWARDTVSYNWRHGLLVAVASFVVAVLGRYGLWRNTATDAKVLAFPAPKIQAQPVRDAA